jgi:hypothetical protein
LQIKTKIVSGHTADSKPVKQEVKGTVILPPLVFPGSIIAFGYGYFINIFFDKQLTVFLLNVQITKRNI